MFVRIFVILAAFATLGKADETECGRSTLTISKIVGGQIAQPKEIPWQVIMEYADNSLRCGASILDDYFLVTAAHCIYGESPSNYKWVAGEWNLDVPEGTEQQLNAVEFITHPNYNSSTLYNDIGLVRLSSPIVFDDYKKPVCRPAQFEEPTGDCVVSGWGDTLIGGILLPRKLHKVTLPIIPDATCRNAYSNDEIADSMLCAGQLLKDSCQGDSGGPLVVQKADGSWTLEGIVSWGLLCGVKAGVYTQVSYFIPWIEDTIASYRTVPHRQYPFIEQVAAKALY